MDKKISVIILLFFIAFNLHAQIALTSGLNMGGAVPKESVEGSSASLLPGAYLGLSKEMDLGQKLYLSPEISFEFKHFGYSSIQKKDTMVVSEVAGIMANIPTYYNANISGKSRFLIINADIPLGFSIGEKLSILFGVYGNYKIYKSSSKYLFLITKF